ncbi:Centromere and Transposable Element-Derived Protein [Pleurotus pulmonarius]
MVKHALSNDKKHRILVELTEQYMLEAIELYQNEHEASGNQKKRGLQEVCNFVERKCWEEKHVHIRVTKSTLERRVKGGKSQAQSNAERNRWLTEEEEDVIVKYAISLADQGWPLSRRRLEEHANLIIAARRGGSFAGVGGNWTHRFAERHSDRLHMYWSSPLESSRARAVNPFTKEAFFSILEKTIKNEEGGEPIPPELTYGADESGIQEGIGMAEQVYGRAGRRIQHQQRSGSRENTTVLEAICADGTSIPPTVIFKGENFQLAWKQPNPLNAAIGHQGNGYTDGEIGVEWIKLFEKLTRSKAAGRWRLLLVDGHNSHYTVAFLMYAREHKIHVLCYPSHSTHAYQGLDVVIFSALKRAWMICRDAYERENGCSVGKANFLKVYADARSKALTKDNILAAFRKTGVSPFNPNAITADMMAPSISSSSQGGLPIEPPSPVRVIVDMIHRELARREMNSVRRLDGSMEHQGGDIHTDPVPTRPTSGVSTPVRMAVDELSNTSASFLTSRAPPQSSSQLPSYQPFTISPFKETRYRSLLEQQPLTELEGDLQAAVVETEARDNRRKHAMVAMQAAVILNNSYALQLQQHLQAREKKKIKGKNKVFGDGMPKLLDGDTFFRVVEEKEAEMQREASERERKRQLRDEHSQALREWAKLEEKKKAHNRKLDVAYHAAVKTWEHENTAAKAAKRKPGWPKPKKADFPYGSPIPRPRMAVDNNGDEGDEGDGISGDDNDDEVD